MILDRLGANSNYKQEMLCMERLNMFYGDMGNVTQLMMLLLQSRLRNENGSCQFVVEIGKRIREITPSSPNTAIFKVSDTLIEI